MENARPTYRVVWDDAHGIARVDWLPGSVGDLPTAQAMTEDISRLGRGPVPILVDMRALTKLERGAREHFVTAQGTVSAIALLAESPVTRMMANFFIGMRRVATPIRMFADSSEAVGWLHEQTR